MGKVTIGGHTAYRTKNKRYAPGQSLELSDKEIKSATARGVVFETTNDKEPDEIAAEKAAAKKAAEEKAAAEKAAAEKK